MSDASLRPLTGKNRERRAGLGVRKDQRDFVETNLFATAESHYRPGWEPLAVYSGETMVGMAVERFHSSGRPEVRLSYGPGNPAAGLYGSAGFRHTGERWGEGEPVMALPL